MAWATLAGLLAALVAPALAAEIGAGKGPSESVFAAQIVTLLLVGRLFGEIMQRFRQPAVVGQLIAGIVLGPSVFGALWPSAHALIFPDDPAQKAMINGVGQLGVLLLLMLTGMETDVALVKRVGRSALSVSVSGIVVPFACGVLLGEFLLPESMLPAADRRFVTALFLGTALSISSIKIVAMVIREMNFMRRDLGQIIVASAIIDDTIGWIIVALIFGIARPGGLDWHMLGVSVGSTALFLIVSYTVGRRVVATLIRWANDRLVSEVPVITIALCIMGAMAVLTDWIGVNTVLGAFVAGVLIGQSPLLTRHIEEQLRGLIIALFAPVFFGLAGLSTDVTILKNPALLGLTALLVLIASAGKFGGAFLGGSIGGLDRRQSLALALGMNARGSTEVIVASIGLSVGALTQNLFSMIVAMAVITTMAMPPTLRWALARLPVSEAEAKRLAQEAYDEHGFVAGLERLLLNVDESPSGRLASRLAGMLAGPRGMPMTVLHLDADSDHPAAIVAEHVAAGADEAGPQAGHGEPAPPIDLSHEVVAEPRGEAVATQGQKGYDLMVLGLEPIRESSGEVAGDVAAALAGFPGARLLVAARGALAGGAGGQKPIFLVPVKGTEASRRAAELACALAQPTVGVVHVLYVASPSDRTDEGRADRRGSKRKLGQGIFGDVSRIAERYDISLRTHLRVSDRPADAILRQAARNRANIILLGADERPSDTMIFGGTAEALLDQTAITVAVLTSPA